MWVTERASEVDTSCRVLLLFSGQIEKLKEIKGYFKRKFNVLTVIHVNECRAACQILLFFFDNIFLFIRVFGFLFHISMRLIED